MNLIRGPFKLLLLQRERVRVPVPPWCENWKHVETYHKEAINLSNNATNYFYYQQFKNIRQILKTPFVSTPFSRDQNSIQQFDEIFVARRFVFLPTQDIILNEIASGESNLVWDPCFGENFVIEKENEIDCYSPPWLRMEQNLCQIMAGRSLFLFTKFPGIMRNGREEAGGSSYRKRKYEFTRRKLRNHETPPLLIEKSHVADTKEGSVIYLRLRTRWPETGKTVRHSTTETTGRKVCQLLECFF